MGIYGTPRRVGRRKGLDKREESYILNLRRCFVGSVDALLYFTKMQGLGNDYIYLNCMDSTPEGLSELAVRLSDRHFGVGSDGLICICPSERADFKMRMFNADGSEGKMCGNGIRCVGKFVYDKGLTTRTTITVETLGGIKTLELSVQEGAVREVTVDMGIPLIEPEIGIAVKGKNYTGIPVSMGNPHCVIFVDEPDALPLHELGPCFERHPHFPEGVNTEFVCVEQPNVLRMRVWERGSGETMACGTGACAVAAVAHARRQTDHAVIVRLAGGELKLRIEEESGRVFMTGPAVTVFEGELPAVSD